MTPAQRRLLELCSSPRTFSELKRLTKLSDSGLSKVLKEMRELGFLQKLQEGYLITTEGMEALGHRKIRAHGVILVYSGISEEQARRVCEILRGSPKFWLSARSEDVGDYDVRVGLALTFPELLLDQVRGNSKEREVK